MPARRFDQAIVVLGTHRSGTSALTGLLGKCGLGMPRTLIAPASSNERGLWESEPIKSLNDEVLHALGQSWYDLAEFNYVELEQAKFQGERRRSEELLVQEFDQASTPVIKDPRLCRLLPLWKPALKKLAGRTTYPFILRSPLESAKSLVARNDFDLDFGLMLWARYLLAGELHTRGEPRAFATYSQLLDDWRETVSSFSAKLEWGLDCGAVTSSEADEFISRDLRHHYVPDPELEREIERIQLVSEVWHTLAGWAEGAPETPADFKLLDGARERLRHAGALLSRLFNESRLERKRRDSALAKAEKLTAELAQAQRALENIESLRQILETASKEFSKRQEDRFDQLRIQLDSDHEKLESTLAGIGESLQQREHLERNLGEALSGQAALRNALERQRAEADKERQELENRIREAEEAARRTSERAELAESEASDRGRKLAELELVADQTRRKYRAAQAMLAREKENNAKLERRLAEARKELEEAHERLGWRVQETVEGWSRQFSRAINLLRTERRKLRKDLELVRSSDLFDASWYLDQYPDVAQSGRDPAEHFVMVGWREARSPSAAFSVTRYLKKHGDVAGMDVNPLIHYLEHGQFEGREIQPTGAVSAAPTNLMPTAAAAPWVGFELPQEHRATWARACSIEPEDPRAILVDGLAVGFASNSSSRSAIENALADLQALSGVAGSVYSSSPIRLPGVPGLADGWFAARNRLSCRWQVEEATVIRAVQCDISRGGRPLLVGEGLATDPLDVVDLDVANPMFPLLVIATNPSGDIFGVSMITFPSLFRGGAHYSELIDLAGAEGASPLQISDLLERKLRAIRCGEAQPLIKSLSVDLRSADGTGPLFQSGVGAWVSRVMGVSTGPAESPASDSDAGTAYLAEAISNEPAHPRRSGGTLRLAADMIPAISVLVDHAGKGSTSRECAMAVIVAEQDSAQPSTRFDPPDTKASFGDIESSAYPQAFPRLRGRGARPALAAIRTLRNPLSEAELLRPDSSLKVSNRGSVGQVTWIVPINGTDADLAGESLAALALQDGSDRFLISLVGPGAVAVLPAAKRLFGSRVKAAARFELRATSFDTALVGYLGSGTILHDARTFSLLDHLLGDESTASASCVLINAEKRGKGWHISPVDVGVIPKDRTVVHGAASAHESFMLWRSVFPVIEPPRQFWLARRESVLRWQVGETAAKEMHLVTTLVSASASKTIEDGVSFLSSCPTAKAWAIAAKVLVG